MKIFLWLIFAGWMSASWGSSAMIAKQWLERMNHAVKEMNYEGHFVYQCHDSLEAMHIRHWMDEAGTRESLYSLTGAAKEVLRDEQSLTIITSVQGKLHIRQQPSNAKLAPVKSVNLPLLLNYYALQMGQQERLAGRDGVVVELRPKDDYRYGYRITLDRLSALPLGLQVINAKGKMQSRIMFTDLQIYPQNSGKPKDRVKVVRAALESAPNAVKPATPPREDEIKKVQQSPWSFENLPPGYFMSEYKELEKDNVDHFVFTDGLSTMSAYIEPVDKTEAFEGFIALGAVNAYARIIEKYQLTVVGEAPEKALKMLAWGVVYRK